MDTNPVWTTSIFVAMVAAVIALAIGFGLPVTGEQQALIMSVVAIVAPFIVPLFANSRVTPLAKPEDEDGSPLVRRSDGQPTNAATRAMRK